MLLFSITASGFAWSQRPPALERNLPPEAPPPRSDIAPPPIASSADDAPLGVDIRGVRLFGLNGEVAANPGEGVVIEDVEGVPAVALKQALAPFIGRPLSQQLVAEARTAVVAAFRSVGRPFVSVTPPPQEITGGVLQLQVVPYRLGDIRAREDASGVAGTDAANSGDTAAAHASRLRARAGEFIDADHLSEDIDWLNRFPYRQVNGVFEPGSRPGETDLTLNITRQKPWRIYGGYSNTGSKATGYDRYFVGFSAGIEALHDLTVSYQLTGSENFWGAPSKGRLAGDRWPGYISHAGRIAIPTLARQSIEIAPNFVATRQETIDRVLSFRNTTFELPVLYRSAASNIWANAPSQLEFYGGTSLKWTKRHTAYDTINLARGDSATFNLLLGLSRYWRGEDGATNSLDMRAVFNPGGGLPGNKGRIWSAQTNGRVESVHYIYGLIELSRSTPLGAIPALRDFSLNTGFTALIGGKALPDTEQLSLGGAWATRGYSVSDGAVDAGLVLRNELRLPTFSLLDTIGKRPAGGSGPRLQDNLSPYVFVDVGYGHNFRSGSQTSSEWAGEDTTLVGAGAAVDYRIASNLLASLSAGWALKNGPSTRRGDFAANARVSVSY
ncbi:ShlB/FhaC/HecB family hemolysin secretion/activation protein [Pseudochelatococcus sp. B33]